MTSLETYEGIGHVTGKLLYAPARIDPDPPEYGKGHE